MKRKPPSASVVLELGRGVNSKQNQKGCCSLVSSSIEGMRVENVVILDQRGKEIISKNIGDEMDCLYGESDGP